MTCRMYNIATLCQSRVICNCWSWQSITYQIIKGTCFYFPFTHNTVIPSWRYPDVNIVRVLLTRTSNRGKAIETCHQQGHKWSVWSALLEYWVIWMSTKQRYMVLNNMIVYMVCWCMYACQWDNNWFPMHVASGNICRCVAESYMDTEIPFTLYVFSCNVASCPGYVCIKPIASK